MLGVRRLWDTLTRSEKAPDDSFDVAVPKGLEASPAHFPEWTATVVLAWFPLSLTTVVAANVLAGRTASLITLTIMVLGFFLVVSTWLLPGKTLPSVLASALAAICPSALSLGLLLAVAYFGD